MFDPSYIALAGSLVANAAQFVLGRRKADAEAAAEQSKASLNDMKTADLLIKNLTEQYRASVAEQERMRTEMASMRHEVESLREEVSDLNARFDEVVRIVRGLPESIQQQFTEALKPRPRRSSRKAE